MNAATAVIRKPGELNGLFLQGLEVKVKKKATLVVFHSLLAFSPFHF